MLAVAKSGHLDSSLSAADIVAALYYRVLRHDPDRPRWPGRDRFVLSKGHAAPIQYAALARHGYFPHEDLMGLRKLDAHLQGHPDMTRTPGVEVSTGSLGQGLSMSLGIALGLRLDRIDEAHVFALLSDGDCQEGQTWEAATAAAHFGVTNLTAIIDYNHLQTDGTTEEVMDIGDVRKQVRGLRAGTRSRSTATTWPPWSRRSSGAGAARRLPRSSARPARAVASR